MVIRRRCPSTRRRHFPIHYLHDLFLYWVSALGGPQDTIIPEHQGFSTYINHHLFTINITLSPVSFQSFSVSLHSLPRLNDLKSIGFLQEHIRFDPSQLCDFYSLIFSYHIRSLRVIGYTSVSQSPVSINAITTVGDGNPR